MRVRAVPRARSRRCSHDVAIVTLACLLFASLWWLWPPPHDQLASDPRLRTTVVEVLHSNTVSPGGVTATLVPARTDTSDRLHTGAVPLQASRVLLSRSLMWFAPFLDASSFGAEATLLVSGLLDAGVLPASRVGIGLLQNSCNDTIGDMMDAGLHARMLSLHRPVEQAHRSVVVCHNLPLYYGRPMAKWAACERCPPPQASDSYAIARAMAETDRVTPTFVTAINSLDEVWVPSNFSADVLRLSGVDGAKLRVVPLAVNTTFWAPGRHVPSLLPRGVQVFGPASVAAPSAGTSLSATLHAFRSSTSAKLFRFISVFKWELRKGWDILLKAYLQEFSSTDPVELYLLTSPFLDGDVMTGLKAWVDQQLAGRKADTLPRLFVIPDRLSLEDYSSMLAAADAFVLPTRGEGWGLPIMEAMSLGLPVIATAWSGPAAYLDDSVGYPLRYSLVDVPDVPNMPSWFLGARWAAPDQQHLSSLMRHVTEHRDEARSRGHAARQRVVQRYSPHVVADIIYEELLRIDRKARRST